MPDKNEQQSDFYTEKDFTHCSRCGGEKDSEGWCANHCTDDDPPLEIKK